MPKIPLNPFLSRHPGESLDMIADGLKLVGTCLAVAGDDDMMLGFDDLRGLSHLTQALREAVQYESERFGQNEPMRAWDAAGGD